MRSSNPVFARNAEFNGSGATRSADPSQWQIDLSGSGQGGASAPPTNSRMTLDSVVEKTALTVGTVVVFAAITWFVIGDVFIDSITVDSSAMTMAWTLAMIGMFAGFAL
ncbi:Bax inhibitor-1/YccA family membrane protein, partial [Mycobacterium sp.]|uniref:Bax inhibitor-1/YccA family membrane protein n=1 Tax=Mycobacterium sp. TaxID=1785 RepID=UPI003A8678AA